MVEEIGKGLESLQVWQEAMDLAVHVIKNLLPFLPVEEKFALSMQIRRAVQSVPANIAEGHGRYYYQEGIRFCLNAHGSLEEVRSHVILAQRLGYIGIEDFTFVIEKINSVRRLLNGYIRYLRESKQGEFIPGFQTREGQDQAYAADTFPFEDE